MEQENRETVVQSHSYVFGGLIGTYNKITNQAYAPDNDYFNKYKEYIDEEYYKMGYTDSYNETGVFNAYKVKTPEELLEIINNASKLYECIIQGAVVIEDDGHFSVKDKNKTEDVMNEQSQSKVK